MGEKKKKVASSDPLQEGLISFYSSQAELMLAQYRNITQLLGPTKDWTHPGTHCEILLRDFLRLNLPQWMDVDKGYIYGRVPDGDKSFHCPEIDILIHNAKDFAPIFRLSDFVIVEPESVIGIIQVKRAFTKVGRSDPLDKGLQQVIGAKQHLLDMLMQKRHSKAVRLSTADLNSSTFSALVAFEESADASLEKALLSRFNSHLSEGRYADGDENRRASIASLPTFVGSLNGKIAYSRRNVMQQTYEVYDADSGRGNISLQLFLYNLMSELMVHFVQLTRPFAFPKTERLASFKIPSVE